MATYNGGLYLKEQLDSILAQSFNDFCLIVHDDGSVDNTLEIILEYANRFPEKIYLIDDGIKTGSARDNFFHLLGHSQAKYVMFSDQDDIWLPDKISKCMVLMNKLESEFPNLPIVVHTDLIVVDKTLNVISKSMFNYQKLPRSSNCLLDILVQNSVTGCAMLVNRTAVSCSLPFNNHAAMHDWWIAASCIKAGGFVEFIEEPTIMYRQHDSNIIGSKEISLRYFLFKLFNVFDLFRGYLIMYYQAKAIDSSVSMHNIFFYKVKNIIKRFFCS